MDYIHSLLIAEDYLYEDDESLGQLKCLWLQFNRLRLHLHLPLSLNLDHLLAHKYPGASAMPAK